MSKKKQIATVYSQTDIGKDVYDLWVSTDMAKQAKCGQFLSVYPKDQARLLPRPISICEVDKDNERLRLVYRVVGEGTKEFSTYRAGNSIFILGSLGNGFPVAEAKGKHAVLLGGGIGIPPMLQLAKEIKADNSNAKISVVLGFRDKNTFLVEDLEKYADVYIATDDGGLGVKGTVLTAVKEFGLNADVMYACGPTPMLRAIKDYAKEKEIKAYLSLEERMACGVGACLGCVCDTKEIDEHSQVNNVRVCADGPVFEAQEVEI
jgi:dihydroorotate dehydrogenase electron transfer subunit